MTEQIAAPGPRRGRGQPRKHDEPLKGLRVRLPESLHAELKATATRKGQSLNDEIIERCAAAAASAGHQRQQTSPHRQSERGNRGAS